MTGCGALLLEALRLDLEPVAALRARAERALELGAGGFLLFGGEAEGVADLVAELRRAAGRPVWVAADLERGAGQQFRGLAALPPPAGLAAHPEPEEAVRRAARRTARDARRLGINWALAPVLDLDVEPRNPIVGARSFGADPEVVARLGVAWIEACQAEGVAACAKHFPGHGRTTADSHVELPAVEAGRDALEADLRPFREAARVVAGVMTAHVAYPALGAAGPATLEPSILLDLLRGELGFEGVVVSDALVMEGFRRGGAGAAGRTGWRARPEGGLTGGAEAAALLAGCDLLLYPPDLEPSIRALERAAERDAAVARRVEESLARSAALLRRFPGGAPAPAAGREDEEEAIRLAAECVTTVGDARAAAALDPGAPLRVVPVWDDRAAPARPPLGAPFAAELRARGWTAEVVGPEGGGGAARRTGTRTEQGVLLLAATAQAWKGTAGLTGEGRAAVEAALLPGRILPVVLGHRRILEDLGLAGVCAWGAEETTERAAARWLDEAARGAGAGGRAGSAGIAERGRWES